MSVFAEGENPRPSSRLDPALTKQSTAATRAELPQQSILRREIGASAPISPRPVSGLDPALTKQSTAQRRGALSHTQPVTERQKINMRERSDRVDFLERYVVPRPSVIFARRAKIPGPVRVVDPALTK